MDPNIALAELRTLAARVLADDTASDLPEKATRMAELVEAIDTWIVRGGFPPDRWNPRRA